ncbi:MAG: hypothetical protein M3014_10530 [Chloroflexota bacterium]|nr:hypothetical protein [Chloroflexota bacterium]
MWLGSSYTRPGMANWLRPASLALPCLAFLAWGPLLLTVADGQHLLRLINATTRLSPSIRIGIMSTAVPLFCALFIAWEEESKAYSSLWKGGSRTGPAQSWGVTVATVTATGSLTSAALLVESSLPAILLLLAAGLVAVARLLFIPPPPVEGLEVGEVVPFSSSSGDAGNMSLAQRVVTVTQIGTTLCAGTMLLVLGALLVGRYAANMESGTTLAAGTGLLALGLWVRLGAAPFGMGQQGLGTLRPVAMLVAGALTPATIIVGLSLLGGDPKIGDSMVGTVGVHAVPWIAAVAALLSGVSAAGLKEKPAQEHANVGLSTVGADRLWPLVVSAISLQTSWALCGVLLGGDTGNNSGQAARGAALLALNLAFAVPLLWLVCGEGTKLNNSVRRLGTFVAVGSLLGLPPLGGYKGMLMIAQEAAGLNGWLLAGLLAGSILTAGAWLSVTSEMARPGAEEQGHFAVKIPRTSRFALPAVEEIMVWTLIPAQLLLFLLSGRILAP